MRIRTLLPGVIVSALAATLAAGCAEKQTVATDPESLKQAAEEINRMSQKEKANKKDNKVQE